MSDRTAYGGDVDGLHPDRNEVLLAALERFEKDEATKADLVLLWFDVALNEADAANPTAILTLLDERDALAAKLSRWSKDNSLTAVNAKCLALEAEVKRLKRMIDEGVHWDDLRETTPEVPRG